MRLRILFSALGITAVLACGAGAVHPNASMTTHPGAPAVALASANTMKTASDGIGWD
jgi:hypothetical protein